MEGNWTALADWKPDHPEDTVYSLDTTNNRILAKLPNGTIVPYQLDTRAAQWQIAKA